MYLCLDVGNSQIHGGFYKNRKRIIDFRLNTKQGWSSDQFGICMWSFCQKHLIDCAEIQGIGISSVVPSLVHHLHNGCIKYFDQEPFFIQSGVKTGILVNRFKNPQEIGADLISSMVAAIKLMPQKNIILLDMGTATTITAVNEHKEFLGGIIVPGISTQIASLSSSAEKLFTVEIKKPDTYIGRITTDCIQSGIYHGQVGALSYLIKQSGIELFKDQTYTVIGTGGFARMFKDEGIFNHFVPDLTLQGIVFILELNKDHLKR